DQPVAAKGVRAVGGSPLDALLQAVSADSPPMRMMVPAATPGRGWATAQVEIRVTGGKGGGQGRGAAAAAVPAQAPAAGDGPSSPRGVGAAVEEFLTFRQRKLSLWQSAVEETVARRVAGPRAASRGARAALPLTDPAVRGSDPARAATAPAAALAA